MKSMITKHMERIIRDKKNRKRYLAVFVCLAAIVSLGTATALKYSGIAMTHKEKVLRCSYKVHEHKNSCYVKQDGKKVLNCGYADYVVHVHNDDCYDANGNLVCPLPEIKEHKHDASCYTEQRVLTCGKEESAGHQHTDKCYKEEKGGLVCGLDEHKHSDSCYGEDGQLTCGMEEHKHSDSCYEKKSVLACGMKEGEGGHQHGDSCYETQKIVTCGQLELHTHDKHCYDKKGNLVCGQIQLESHVHNGDCFEVVEVANGQNAVVGGGNADEAAAPGEAADADQTAEAGESVEDEAIDTGREIFTMEEEEEAADNSQAAEGEAVSDAGETTEGEAAGEAGEAAVNGADGTAADAGENADAAEAKYEKSYKGSGYMVKVAYTDSAKIPENAELIVEQITKESNPDRYKKRQAEAKKALKNKNTTVHALFDIGFYVDGKEIEPEDAVNVTIQFLDDNGLPEGTPVKIVHFADKGNEVLEGGDVDSEGNTSFKTKSFSEFLMADAGREFAITREVTTGSIKDKLTKANLRVNGSTYVPGTPLNRGEQFQAELEWELDRTAMQETLTWAYTIPEQIHVDDVKSAILFDEENNRMGTYSIENGVLTVTYDKVQDINKTKFRLNATWDSSVTGDTTTIEWNKDLKTPVKFSDSAIAVTKNLTKTDTLSQDISSGGTVTGKSGSLVYTYQIDIKATKGDLTNVKLTDTLDAKDFSFVKGYFENGGKRYDYRYMGADRKYIYRNFVGTAPGSGVWSSCDAAGKEITAGGMELKKDQVCSMEYAVMLPADRRFELDSQKNPTSLKNTAKAEGTFDKDKVESSVTVEQTYRPEEKWIIKRRGELTEGDVNKKNVAPFTLVINGGKNYDMSGTVVKDELGTPGMKYITPDNEKYGSQYGTMTIKTSPGNQPLTPTWVVMKKNYAKDEIGASRIRTGKEILEDFYGYYGRYQRYKAGKYTEDKWNSDYKSDWERYRDYFYQAIGQTNWVGKNPDELPAIKEYLSAHVFTTFDKTAFYWLVPDSDGTGQSYELTYYTDISNVNSNVLANSASADWKHIVAGDEVGDFLQQVHLDKRNEGVKEVKGEDGTTKYLVDWTITVDVPSGSDAIPNVYLYDTLPKHTISTLSDRTIYDWLANLNGSKLGLSQSDLKRKHSSGCYTDGKLNPENCPVTKELNAITQGAFNITVSSDDAGVAESVQNKINEQKMTVLGKPVGSGINNDSYYRVYASDSDESSLGQLTLNDGKMTSTKFGIWLGKLPATKDEKGKPTKGYTITVKYTTQITPGVMETLEGTSSAYNAVELRALLNDNEYTLGYADSSYKIAHTSVTNGIDKYITNFDPATNRLSYEVRINPNAEMNAIKSTDYKISDNLDLTGAQYVEDSFRLYFPGTVTDNPNKLEKGTELPKNHWRDLKWDREEKSKALIWSTEKGLDNQLKNEQVLTSSSYLKSFTLTNADKGSSQFNLIIRNSYKNSLALDGPEKYKGKLIPMILQYDVQLPTTIGDGTHIINNGAELWMKPNDAENVQVDGVKASFDFTSAMHKKLNPYPTEQNGYNAGFVINVDTTVEEWLEAMKQLEGARRFTVKDVMSENLNLNLGSLKVTKVENGTKTVLGSSDYEFRTEKVTDKKTGEVKNVLYVTLDVSLNCIYRIEYTAKVSGEIETDVSYSNAATVEGTSIKSEEIDREVHISEQTGISTGEIFEIELKKRDGNNLNASLNATFKLSKIKLICGEEEHTHTDECKDEEGNTTCTKWEHTHEASCYGTEWVDCLSTPQKERYITVNGNQFLWNGKNDKGQEVFPDTMLEKGVWYKLEEMSVPPGYRGSVTYFYTGEVGSAPAIPSGVKDPQYCPFRSKAVDLYLPNYKAELNLLKVDITEESKGKNLDGAVFALYDKPDCYNANFTGSALAEVNKATNGKYTLDLSGSQYKPNMVYYLKETKAPDGYIISDQKYCVIFNDEGIVRLVEPAINEQGGMITPVLEADGTLKSGTGTEVDHLSNGYLIPNETTYELPKTGGVGTTIVLAGGIMLLSFGMMYNSRLRRIRRSKRR